MKQQLRSVLGKGNELQFIKHYQIEFGDRFDEFGEAQSIFGGWDELSWVFRWLGSGFSDCTNYRFELLAAGVSGDLAYTVGFEHTSVSWDGVPLEPYTLRVTHVYHRENGEWKIVHRHGDRLPIDQSPPTEAPTLWT